MNLTIGTPIVGTFFTTLVHEDPDCCIALTLRLLAVMRPEAALAPTHIQIHTIVFFFLAGYQWLVSD
jgi:hypothetical protein